MNTDNTPESNNWDVEAIVVAALARPIFSLETFSNPGFLLKVGISLIAAILVTELGFLQRWFENSSLSGQEWVLCILFGSAVLWVMEILKFINRREK